MRKNTLLIIVFGLVILTFTSCMPGSGTYHNEYIAGFFSGIWHGWIAPISLIISFFNPSVRIYEVYNTGFWYDFGFYMAVISGFGGISLSRKKWKSQKDG